MPSENHPDGPIVYDVTLFPIPSGTSSRSAVITLPEHGLLMFILEMKICGWGGGGENCLIIYFLFFLKKIEKNPGHFGKIERVTHVQVQIGPKVSMSGLPLGVLAVELEGVEVGGGEEELVELVREREGDRERVRKRHEVFFFYFVNFYFDLFLDFNFFQNRWKKGN